jgi:hypothetical protein
MAISDDNRKQFELIGEDQLALALTTGTLQSLGMTEEKETRGFGLDCGAQGKTGLGARTGRD